MCGWIVNAVKRILVQIGLPAFFRLEIYSRSKKDHTTSKLLPGARQNYNLDITIFKTF